MKKVVAGFICGALLFSGVSYAASESLTAKISSYKLFINGNEKKLKNKPVTINGTTYLSLRDISEAVGYTVDLKSGNILLSNGLAPTVETKDTPNKSENYTILDSLDLKLNDKYYGLTMGVPIYIKGDTVYCTFEASMIDLIVSIASNDYKIRISNNDNPDYVTAEHFATNYKYLEIIEKQKSYRLKNIDNGNSYEILLDKKSSKGVVYLESSNKYLVPLNDVFKSLELNMEAKYEPVQKRAVLKFK